MNHLRVYVDFLKGQADVKKPLKVVLDCSNGPAGLVLRRLKIPNAKFIILNSRIDGRFPAHGPNPLEVRASGDVKREIKRQKADLGVVFDADADRAVFVDDSGRVAPVHAILYLLSRTVKPPYVADIYVARTLNHLKLLPVSKSPVGTYFMKKTMKRRRAKIAAEFSGHYYFREMKNADSGILATIKVMNTLSELPYKMSYFCDLLPEFYFKQWNVQKPKNTPKSRITKDWFIIVRPSNTEPVVRFFFGSKNKKSFQELKSLFPLLRA